MDCVRCIEIRDDWGSKMFVIYDRATREIVGITMVSQDSSGLAAAQSMKKVVPADRGNPNLMEFLVHDDETVANEIYKYEIRFSSSGTPKELVRKDELRHIDLSVDALDHDGDGIPEIGADGKSKVTITASIRNEEGAVVTGATNEVHFITTGGILSDRIVKCQGGVAKTTLTSVKETLTPTITAISKGVRTGKIKVEFVHPSIKL